MAAYIQTLKDSSRTNIIYPQTKAEAVFLNDNSNVENVLQTKLTTPNGLQGQVLGYIDNNIVGAITLQTGGLNNLIIELNNSNWITDGEYVYQQIECQGMTQNNAPFIIPQYNILNTSQLSDWNKILYVESNVNYCRIYATSILTNTLNIMIVY